jgi:hypothetical protein
VQDLDRGFKEVARRGGRGLARMAGLECDRWTPIVSEVQMAERYADRAFMAHRGSERFAVYFEAYARWDRNAPWNVMTKAAALSERHRVPTLPVLFILQPRRYEPQGGEFRLEVGGELIQQVRFREVCLWEQAPKALEAVPALLPMFPLCRHSLPVRDAIMYAAGSIRQRVHGQTEQADALFLLSIFGSLADRRLDTEAIIGSEVMMESPVWRKAIERGQREAHQRDVLDLLEDRFGVDAVRAVADAVNALEDVKHLRTLNLVAARCADLDEFRRAVATPPARATRGRRRR